MKTRLDFRTQPFLNQKTGKHHEKLRSVRLANVQNYDIDAVIKFALDNNYIEGAKYELAKGIVQGVIEAERELVKMGHSLTINKWMSVRPSVEGSVDAVKRQLTAGKNRIRIKVRPLKEMKLALDDFSFRCIDDDLKSKDAPTPVIEYLYSSGHEDEHDAMYEAAAFAIKGTNLATAAECELTFKDRNGKEHTTAFVGADGDFKASDTLIEIEDETFFNDIREKCDAAGSVLDTTAGVTVKLTFPDGTILTHDATIAD